MALNSGNAKEDLSFKRFGKLTNRRVFGIGHGKGGWEKHFQDLRGGNLIKKGLVRKIGVD